MGNSQIQKRRCTNSEWEMHNTAPILNWSPRCSADLQDEGVSGSQTRGMHFEVWNRFGLAGHYWLRTRFSDLGLLAFLCWKFTLPNFPYCAISSLVDVGCLLRHFTCWQVKSLPQAVSRQRPQICLMHSIVFWCIPSWFDAFHHVLMHSIVT